MRSDEARELPRPCKATGHAGKGDDVLVLPAVSEEGTQQKSGRVTILRFGWSHVPFQCPFLFHQSVRPGNKRQYALGVDDGFLLTCGGSQTGSGSSACCGADERSLSAPEHTT